MPADTEIELKLALSPAQAAAFEAAQTRRAVPESHTLVTRYFDTPDGDLRANGVALRLRRDGRRYWQTLKTSGVRAGGLSSRAEFETRVARNAFDWPRLPDAAQALVPEALRANLVCVFETRFTRLIWLVQPRRGAKHDGTLIEVALDRGEIIAGTARAALCELELELKAGPPSALFEYARNWAARYDALPLDASKAGRGAALARGESARPVAAALPRLSGTDEVEAGFEQSCLAALAALQANLAGLRPTERAARADRATLPDPEYVHQARVALRRLRSALRLFRRVCPVPPPLKDGASALAAALGRARDIDVLADQTVPAITQGLALTGTGSGAIANVLAAADTARHAAYAQMHAELRALEPGRWLLDIHRWLHGRSWRTQTDPGTALSAALADWARVRLVKQQRRLARLALQTGDDASARHTLRIAIKRQRYALETFASLWPSARTAPALVLLKSLQAGLGAANDRHVAATLIAALPDVPPLTRAYAQGWLAGNAAAATDLDTDIARLANLRLRLK